MKICRASILMLLLGISLVLGIALIGCGGGSSGTGGQQYQGTVLSRTSQPLPGVRITITQSGDSTVTDANGYYSVVTDTSGGSVTYTFEAPGIQIQFTLEGVSANASVVTVNFILDEQEQSADPSFIDIDEDDGSNSSGNYANDNDSGASSSQGSAGSSSSLASSSSDDDHGSGSSDDDSGLSSSEEDDGSSSSSDDDISSSDSSEDDSSSSSDSSSESSESSDDDGGDSGSSGGGSGSGSGGSSGSSSSDDD